MSSVLITGANRGVGLALAEAYLADGWQVHACCRRPDRCRPLLDLGGAIALHRLDVTDGLQVESLARSFEDEPLDLLINNAGLSGSTDGLEQIDFEEWQQVLAVDTLAPARMASAFWPAVVASERRTIVNISSAMASIGVNDRGGYYALRSSQAALNMVTRNIAIELKDKGAIVIAVDSGWLPSETPGPEAGVSAEQSAVGLRGLIDHLSPEQSGRFFDWQGRELPW